MTEDEADIVSCPAHYVQGEIDPLALMAVTGEDEAYAKWAIITYVYRYAAKGQAEDDLLKALFYLSWLIGCVWKFSTDQKRELAQGMVGIAKAGRPKSD